VRVRAAVDKPIPGYTSDSAPRERDD